MIFLVACKPEVQSGKISTLGNNQISISSNMMNSAGVQEFAREIERRQKESPDTFFEVVKREDKKERSLSTSTSILSHFKDDHLYPNKNFYIFIALGDGSKNEGIQKTDWDAIYFIMNYVSGSNYRVLINVMASAEHLRLASEDANTEVILWSSHGNKEAFYDYKGDPVPYDIFQNKSKSFYQFILSSCEGRVALDNNYDFTGVQTWAWSGLTTSVDLKKFLVSDSWSIQDGKVLSETVQGYTCTANGGSKYSLMEAEARSKVAGYDYSSLSDCETQLENIKNGACSEFESVAECLQ